LYCATVLENNGFEVSILDQASKGFSTKQAVDWIKKEGPDFLGLSVLSSSFKEAVKISGLMKEVNPKVYTVLGNYHPTFNDKRILKKYSQIDIIVKGEGEHTCLELIQCVKNGENFKKIPGISYRKHNGEIQATQERALLRDVDSLPFPNRRLLDSEYASKMFGIDVATKKFTSLISSRGCPFQCKFCACGNFARGIWRPRSVENVIEEIEVLYNDGYRQFLFVDDNFTLNSRRIIKICNEIRKRKLKIDWFCDSRVDNVQYRTLREMVKAGCKILYFGMESANQRILDYYNKNITPEQSIIASRKARKAGFDIIVGSFIVGAPDETRKEICKTLQFAQQTSIDFPSFNILGAPIGSPIWNELVQKGFINVEKYWEKGVYVSQVVPSEVSFQEIGEMIYDSFIDFYNDKKRLLSEFLRTLTSPFRMRALIHTLPQLQKNLERIKRGIKFKE
jgi:radical SAM superfamily enzyme YgiQ (UPF0313 family)